MAATVFGHTHARNFFRWDGTANEKAGSGIPAIITDNAGHWKSPSQAILHLEITPGTLRIREFATKDAWKFGAWTPRIWSFSLPS